MKHGLHRQIQLAQCTLELAILYTGEALDKLEIGHPSAGHLSRCLATLDNAKFTLQEAYAHADHPEDEPRSDR